MIGFCAIMVAAQTWWLGWVGAGLFVFGVMIAGARR